MVIVRFPTVITLWEGGTTVYDEGKYVEEEYLEVITAATMGAGIPIAAHTIGTKVVWYQVLLARRSASMAGNPIVGACNMIMLPQVGGNQARENLVMTRFHRRARKVAALTRIRE